MAETPEQGQKPYLVDPREEGTRPPGIDGWWLVRCSAVQFSFLPRRFHGLPPLFYPVAFLGLVSGVPVTVTVIIQITAAHTSLPLWLSVATVLNASLFTAVGILQGIGTLHRRRWGLTAVYVWLGLAWIVGVVAVLCIPFREDRDIGGGDVFALALFLAELGAICLYYHNRRAVFRSRNA